MIAHAHNVRLEVTTLRDGCEYWQHNFEDLWSFCEMINYSSSWQVSKGPTLGCKRLIVALHLQRCTLQSVRSKPTERVLGLRSFDPGSIWSPSWELLTDMVWQAIHPSHSCFRNGTKNRGLLCICTTPMQNKAPPLRARVKGYHPTQATSLQFVK